MFCIVNCFYLNITPGLAKSQVYALWISVIPVAIMLYYAKPEANYLFYNVGADSLLIIQTDLALLTVLK
ncbi:MAG: hypothetical protein R2847_02080 [Bacteroidia bacterium]